MKIANEKKRLKEIEDKERLAAIKEAVAKQDALEKEQYHQVKPGE
jgi:hypothetical protein